MMAESCVPGHPEPSPTTGRTNRPNPSHAYNIQEDRNTTIHNQGSNIQTVAAEAVIVFGGTPEWCSRQRQASGSMPRHCRSVSAGVRRCAEVALRPSADVRQSAEALPQHVGRSSAVRRSAISGGGMSSAVRRSAISGGGMSSAVRRSAISGGGTSSAVRRSAISGGGMSSAVRRSGISGGDDVTQLRRRVCRLNHSRGVASYTRNADEQTEQIALLF